MATLSASSATPAAANPRSSPHLNALMPPGAGPRACRRRGRGREGTRACIEIRREVGLVFQYPEYQLFEETVEKDVGFGPRNLGLDEETVRSARARGDRAGGPRARTCWTNRPSSFPAGRSGAWPSPGVLAMKPGTLVLDEPAAGLDPAGREELLTPDSGHPRQAASPWSWSPIPWTTRPACATACIVLNHGRVAFDAAPGEVFRHEEELRRHGAGRARMRQAGQGAQSARHGPRRGPLPHGGRARAPFWTGRWGTC